MNRLNRTLISSAAAGFLVAGPIAFTPAFAQFGLEVQQNQDRDQGRDQNRDRDHDWNQDRNQNRDWNVGCDNYRDQRGNRDDRCDSRKQWRDTRSDARWDEGHYNGYYNGNGWHYGPPPQLAYGQRNFTLGYHPWNAGDRLGYFNGRYTEVNYRSQNLKKPRRGDHWVRDDRGVFILASISSGLIRQVLNRSAR
jgi:Ni/Co efflux regulator RcnB